MRDITAQKNAFYKALNDKMADNEMSARMKLHKQEVEAVQSGQVTENTYTQTLMNKKYAEFYDVMLADGSRKVVDPGAPNSGRRPSGPPVNRLYQNIPVYSEKQVDPAHYNSYRVVQPPKDHYNANEPPKRLPYKQIHSVGGR